jgi:hypothetical protein
MGNLTAASNTRPCFLHSLAEWKSIYVSLIRVS